MQYRINYDGHVQGQQRPRHRMIVRKDGRVFSQTYEDARSRDFKAVLHLMAQEKLTENGGQRLSGAVGLNLSIRIEVPKSFSKSKRELALNHGIFPTRKPDLDNVLKAVMDALNGVLYEDDKQVCSVRVTKYYAEREGLTVSVSEDEGV